MAASRPAALAVAALGAVLVLAAATAPAGASVGPVDAGVASAFDDRTRGTVSAVPVPLWVRSGLRLLLVLVPTAAAWVALVTWADRRVGGALPSLALSLETAAVAGVVVAVAAVLARWPGLVDPGLVAGPVLAGFAFGAPGLPDRLALAPMPGPGRDAAHVRVGGLLAVAVAALAVAVRDPASPSLRRDRQGAEHPPGQLRVAGDLDVCVPGRQPAAGQEHEGRVGHP
jgi:hypothetical protein